MEKLTKYLAVVILAVVLAGCSALDMIPSGGPKVNTNAQVGQENTQQVVANQTSNEVQGDQTNSRDAIEVKDGGVTINNSPLWLIVVAVMGWALPSLGSCLKWLWYSLPFTRAKRPAKS